MINYKYILKTFDPMLLLMQKSNTYSKLCPCNTLKYFMSIMPLKFNICTTLCGLLMMSVTELEASSENDSKKIVATKIEISPKINGILDDEIWGQIIPANNFIINKPSFGLPASFDTEVKLAYDDEAIYVGAVMHDPEPNKIINWLSARDNLDNVDMFGIGFDTYNDDQNAFVFAVSPSGSQMDYRESGDNTDVNWDAVWQAKTSINEDSWVAEIKIPFSAIRFTSHDVQDWGLGLYRYVPRLNEETYWTAVDPNQNSVIRQYGEWSGIQNIKPPVRLVLLPYITTGVEHVPALTGDESYDTNLILNGGMDLKYGLTDAFTLDVTLIPDFGQVQSDNLVLNTGPFEVVFEERRPFFTEGTDIFSSANVGYTNGQMFYSRRIGSTPLDKYAVYDQLSDNEQVMSNPDITKLYNAFKLSGRTNNKTGIGLLNAISAPTYAVIKNTTSGVERKILTNPITNYNVLAIDQTLKNNSRFGIYNTSVIRSGNYYDANVSSINFDMRNKKNSTSTYGMASLSILTAQQDTPTSIGYRYSIGHSKISGKWRYNFIHSYINKNFDQNDFGFQFRNNEMEYLMGFNYVINKPTNKLNSWNLGAQMVLNNRVEPLEFQQFVTSFNASITTKKNNSWGIYVESNPIAYNDYYEARTPGRKYRRAPVGFMNTWFSSNPTKKLSFEAYINLAESTIPHDPFMEYNLTPTIKLGNKFDISYGLNYNHDFRSYNFVDRGEQDSIILAARHLLGWSHRLVAKYYMNPQMNIILNARHYWSQFKVDEFVNLEMNGDITPINWAGNYDKNFDAFNIDMVYSWQFLPGSMLNIIWKQAIIYNDNDSSNQYLTNIKNTFHSPVSNSISLKLIYYLDALKFRKLVRQAY